MRFRLGVFCGASLAVALLLLLRTDRAPSAPANVDLAADAATAALPPKDAAPDLAVPEAPSIAIAVTRENTFAWPTTGILTSYFGLGHPTGIDISLDWGEESPIFASAAGRVSFAGGSACCSYGYHVVLEHEGGLSTLYGHLSEIAVQAGQEVRQGDLLGLGGDSGAADGKHLHFEVQVDGVPVDPLRFLPAQQEVRFGPGTDPGDCRDRAIRADPASNLRVEFRPAGPGEARIIAASIAPEVSGTGAPFPELVEAGPLTVQVRFNRAATASGQTVRFRLETTIARGETQETFSCWLDFRTMRTLPNSDATIARYRARQQTPTPVPPTPTPTMWRPSPTAPPQRGTPVPLGGGSSPGAQPSQSGGPRPLPSPTRAAGR